MPLVGRAAMQGESSEAERNYGKCTLTGTGVARSEIQALTWWLIAKNNESQDQDGLPGWVFQSDADADRLSNALMQRLPADQVAEAGNAPAPGDRNRNSRRAHHARRWLTRPVFHRILPNVCSKSDKPSGSRAGSRGSRIGSRGWRSPVASIGWRPAISATCEWSVRASGNCAASRPGIGSISSNRISASSSCSAAATRRPRRATSKPQGDGPRIEGIAIMALKTTKFDMARFLETTRTLRPIFRRH